MATTYFVYLIIRYTESSRCNKIEAVTYHYHCTPCGGFSLCKYKDIYAFFFCAGTRVLFKSPIHIFLAILNFLLTYSSLKIRTVVLGSVFVLINIDLIPVLHNECCITPGRTKNFA